VCVVKLRQLRGYGNSSAQDGISQRQGIQDTAYQQSRDNDIGTDEDTGNSVKQRPPASPALSDAASNRNFSLPGKKNTIHTDTDAPNETDLPTRFRNCVIDSQSEDSSVDPLSLRILVVEDNAVNRRLLGAFLKRYGCRDVQYAENGALAVKMVERRSEGFDVIFMGAFLANSPITTSEAYADSNADLSMPIMNGFAATREIRHIEHDRCSAESSSDPITPAHIVALTGLASDRDENKAFAAGMDKFITKPVQFDKLLTLLKQWKEDSPSREG
jgi:CheY-like chemotaxis protein